MMNLKTTNGVDQSVVIQTCIEYICCLHMTLSLLTQYHRNVSKEIVVVMLELSTMFFKQNVLLNSIVATPRYNQSSR